MITLINEENMTLENYNRIHDIPTGRLSNLLVEYNFTIDRKIIIEYYTLENCLQYNSDVI